jgi:hypothetical protein
MKTKIGFALMLLLLTGLSLLAQEPGTVPAPTSANVDLMLKLLPLIVPMLIAIIKMEIPKLPTWCLPILAPLLGAFIDWLTALATGGHPNPIASALLGSAGVGLREVYDQLKQQITPPKP